MIIDCHGHYTTEPAALGLFRDRQLAGLVDATRRPTTTNLGITDDEIRQSLEGAQLKLQRERGTDVTIFSPRASGMAHHVGTAQTSAEWTRTEPRLVLRLEAINAVALTVAAVPAAPTGQMNEAAGKISLDSRSFK